MVEPSQTFTAPAQLPYIEMTSPTEQLEFPVEFCRLRWRSLQAHIRLWSACRTLQTSPPPACVANAGAAGARLLAARRSYAFNVGRSLSCPD